MFQWMEILAQGPVAKAILAFSIVAAVGLAFGSLGIRRIRLGAAGVLFAGIFFGQIGMHIDERILEFVRDFGLSLFVYTVGPGFFSSTKRSSAQCPCRYCCLIRRTDCGWLSISLSLLGAGDRRIVCWWDERSC
ncbi:MAG: hypothetical protein JO066_04180 [Verrucomicrobia bacterium]|nr:hypothetical protein [Verrucomicrobiota bacterium]